MAVEQDHPKIHRNIHPPLVMLVHLLAAFVLNWLHRLPLALPDYVEWAGYLLVLTGLGLAVSAVNRFKGAYHARPTRRGQRAGGGGTVPLLA
jgi:protein-S-isoprenylcysteine O-methyltransferase Ste14